MNRLKQLQKELRALANPEKEKVFLRFFKTGPGEYAEGDKFLGLTVPQQRKIARKYSDLDITEILQLLKSKIHEERFTALVILIGKFKQANESEKTKIANFYLKNTKYVNNWDLVDLSSEKILGEYLVNKPRTVLYKLAKSKNLWERRISVISTFAFIKRNDFDDTLKIAKILMQDRNDLIHKAIGWMIREVGKRSASIHKKYLNKHYKQMPRTALRYAIEKLPPKQRLKYLNGKI